jgi:hypothetical protein
MPLYTTLKLHFPFNLIVTGTSQVVIGIIRFFGKHQLEH